MSTQEQINDVKETILKNPDQGDIHFQYRAAISFLKYANDIEDLAIEKYGNKDEN